MENNTGGAGGFHEGVKKAYEMGYDWLWLMDDDVSAVEDALETMLKYCSISKCIHPSKRYEDGSLFPWGGHFDEKRVRIRVVRFPFTNRDDKYLELNFGCFEGMLINRSVVEKIGYPDSRFFINGDDTIYGYLASRVTKTIYIRDVCFVKHQHYEKVAGRISTRPSVVSMYYDVRNRFLVCEYLKENGKTGFLSHLFIFLYFMRRVLAVLVYDTQKLKRFQFLVRGFRDGMKKKWGKLANT
jgi:GT2 family glycosyltransferase